MSTAIIYIRVSTDEQAQKGYSQRSQEEKLNKYCKDHHIEILETIFEDHSAKNFDRPAWSVMMKHISSYKPTRPTYILFTRWDRFSRNTANAYYVITQLQRMGVELQAIDQPLDMSIPENKVLLAMYIVTAEVENDRRSLNIRQGVLKAKKEGRYIGLAPIGYINISLPDGKKIIVPREPEATLVKKIFEEFEETVSIRSFYKMIVKKGLKCSLNAFHNILQNPIYYGKIRVKSLDGKSIREAPGIHQPLISEDLFNLVQSKIKRRDKKYVKQNVNSQLMFRGLLYCPLCSKKLSGSGSKGRSGHYFYYHCYYPCRYRIRADKTNEHLLSIISLLKANTEYVPIFQSVLKKVYESLYQQGLTGKESINKSLHKMVDRVANARELLIKGIINEEDYLSIKDDCENRIDILGAQLNAAYRIDLQRRKDLKKLITFFMAPSLIFKKTDDLLQLKTALLFLKEKLIYMSDKIEDNIKPEAQIIYGNSAPNFEYSYDVAENTTDLINGQEELIIRIMWIAKDRGNTISSKAGYKTLVFLLKLAEICTSIKI